MSALDAGFGRVAVLGAGTMGHGIAQVSGQAGARVVLYDIDDAALDRALRQIEATLDKGVALGKVESEVRDAALERISTSNDVERAVADADLVIEAVPESLDLKRDVFRSVESAVGEDALLATNTSSLSITRIAEPLERADRFVGLHFFNPVHIMKLVEVVRGESTASETVERATEYVRAIRKEPVVVADSPGFASSRLGVVLGLEAMRMVEEGVAEPEAIDRAMELGYRHPMGPLKLTDLVGLDVRLKISEYLHEELGSEAFRPPEILRRKVDEGHLGKKTGRGFYEWEDEG